MRVDLCCCSAGSAVAEKVPQRQRGDFSKIMVSRDTSIKFSRIIVYYAVIDVYIVWVGLETYRRFYRRFQTSWFLPIVLGLRGGVK